MIMTKRKMFVGHAGKWTKEAYLLHSW
jgi:hypothetical protein